MSDNKEELEKLQSMELKKVIEKGKENIPIELQAEFEEKMMKVFTSGGSLKKMMNIPQDFLEESYEKGYYLYKSGNFKEALPIFHCLQYLDPDDPRFVFGIAATYHHMKQYQEAAGNYLLYEAFDNSDPLLAYYLYDCFSHLGDRDWAIHFLKKAHYFASEDPKYQALKDKLEVEIQGFASLIEKEDKKESNVA